MSVSFPEREGASRILGRPKNLYRIPSDLRHALSGEVRTLREDGSIAVEIAERPSDEQLVDAMLDAFAEIPAYREGMTRLLTNPDEFSGLLSDLVLYRRETGESVFMSIFDRLQGQRTRSEAILHDEMLHLPEPGNSVGMRMNLSVNTRDQRTALIGDGPSDRKS